MKGITHNMNGSTCVKYYVLFFMFLSFTNVMALVSMKSSQSVRASYHVNKMCHSQLDARVRAFPPQPVNRCESVRNRVRRRTVIPPSIFALCFFKPAFAWASSNTIHMDLTKSYHLSRILFLRLLAVVYISALLVASNQNEGLIGDRGITPARRVLENAQNRGEFKSQRRKEWIKQRHQYTPSRSKHFVSNIIQTIKMTVSDCHIFTLFRDKFWYRTDGMDRPLPTLLWFAKDRSNLNPWLRNLANMGLFLATIMFATGSANVPLLFALYIIQRSLMAVGGPWYGYGWEPQLAELTFHALFFVPLLSLDPFFGLNGSSGPYPVPSLVLRAVRFYLFKIMLGAGLIKIKSSDQKWKDMTSMDYFYETQVSLT